MPDDVPRDMRHLCKQFPGRRTFIPSNPGEGGRCSLYAASERPPPRCDQRRFILRTNDRCAPEVHRRRRFARPGHQAQRWPGLPIPPTQARAPAGPGKRHRDKSGRSRTSVRGEDRQPPAGKPGTPAPRRAGSPDPGDRGRGRESGLNRLPDAPGAGTSDTDNGTARPSRTPRHRLPRHQIARARDTAQRHGAEARGQKTLPSKHGPPGNTGPPPGAVPVSTLRPSAGCRKRGPR
jgi:hypothetical protein